MRKFKWAALFVLSLAAIQPALGQTLKEQIVGTWRQVSVYTEVGGAKTYPYGDKIVGLAVFSPSGYVISYLSKAELPKFAAENRLKGTDKEYRTVGQGMVAGFGRYTIDGDTVSIAWEASSYPNRAGTTE